MFGVYSVWKKHIFDDWSIERVLPTESYIMLISTPFGYSIERGTVGSRLHHTGRCQLWEQVLHWKDENHKRAEIELLISVKVLEQVCHNLHIF